MITKLSDFTKKVELMSDEESKKQAIVFSDTFYTTLQNIQSNNKTNHRVSPTKLTDGRWMICADVVRESLVGTLYKDVFNTLYSSQVDVIPIKDAISLLPVSEDAI